MPTEAEWRAVVLCLGEMTKTLEFLLAQQKALATDIAALSWEVQELRAYRQEQEAARQGIGAALADKMPEIIAASLAASRASAARGV